MEQYRNPKTGVTLIPKTDQMAGILASHGWLVDEVKENYPVHTGGGWYELSNGERVQGKQLAEEAENTLSDDKE